MSHQQIPLFAGAQPLPDICRNRHGGNAQSKAANEKVHSHKAGISKTIRELIYQAGKKGMTIHELCAALNKTPNAISGRLSEMKRDLVLRENGVRNGAAILVTA